MHAVRETSIWRNLRWGITWGIAMACIYSLYVVVVFLFRGAEPFEANDVTLPTLVFLYFLGGVGGGGLLGLLRPLARNRLAAVFIGMIVAIPFFLGVALADEGLPSQWSGETIFAVSGASLTLGGICGYIAWGWRDGTRKSPLSRRRLP